MADFSFRLLASLLLVFAPAVAHAVGCQQVLELLRLDVPIEAIVDTIENSDTRPTIQDLQCLADYDVPNQIQVAARAKLHPAGPSEQLTPAEGPRAPALPPVQVCPQREVVDEIMAAPNAIQWLDAELSAVLDRTTRRRLLVAKSVLVELGQDAESDAVAGYLCQVLGGSESEAQEALRAARSGGQLGPGGRPTIVSATSGSAESDALQDPTTQCSRAAGLVQQYMGPTDAQDGVEVTLIQPKVTVTTSELWELIVDGQRLRTGPCGLERGCTQFSHYVKGESHGSSWTASVYDTAGQRIQQRWQVSTESTATQGLPRRMQCSLPGEFIFFEARSGRDTLLCQSQFPSSAWRDVQDALACALQSYTKHEVCTTTPCTFQVVPGPLALLGRSPHRVLSGLVDVEGPLVLRGRRGHKVANHLASWGLLGGFVGTLAGVPILLITDPGDRGHNLGATLSAVGGIGLVVGFTALPHMTPGDWEKL